MKRMLLIGELNQTLSEVNKHLSTEFQTQICMDSLELVKGMTKVFEADMAVVCLVGVGELDKRILDFFSDRNPQIPVLLIGTSEECDYYQKYYESNQFHYIIRPITLRMLLQKCIDMMQIPETELEIETMLPKEPIRRRKRILVVDDNGILLRSVKTMLEDKYDVSVATSGKMAIKQAKRKVPDLILLDYEMPEWDGKRTLEEIQKDEDLKDIPVVFLTAVADKEHIIAVLEMKPSGYLLKPIERQKLFDTIQKAFIFSDEE